MGIFLVLQVGSIQTKEMEALTTCIHAQNNDKAYILMLVNHFSLVC